MSDEKVYVVKGTLVKGIGEKRKSLGAGAEGTAKQLGIDDADADRLCKRGVLVVKGVGVAAVGSGPSQEVIEQLDAAQKENEALKAQMDELQKQLAAVKPKA